MINVSNDLRIMFLLLLFIRDSYKLAESEMPSVKDVWKWIVGSQFGKITNSNFTPDSDFQIIVSVSYPYTVKECLPL